MRIFYPACVKDLYWITLLSNLLASAYGRSKGNIQSLLKNSEILYIDKDKNRAEAWLMSLGLQLPSDQPSLGSIGRVSYSSGKVNISGKKILFEKVTENNNAPKKKYSAADTDGEYLSLAEKYRDGTATEEETEQLRKAVEQAAKKAGYDTPMLYHGTGSFGFTEFDLSKMDDKSSVFATSSADVARTYSGATGSRAITDQSPDVSKMSDADVVEALNDYVKRYGDGLESVYSFVEPESAKNIARDAEKATADLAALVSKKVSEYADKLAKDFNDKNYTDHRHLVDFQEVLYLGDRNKVLSNLYMLINHTKVFSGTNADDLLRAVKDLYWITLLSNVFFASIVSSLVKDLYWITLLSNAFGE